VTGQFVNAGATTGGALEAALAADAAGLCVLPPREDGSKAPDVPSWTGYQRRRPTDDEILTWYSAGRSGVGLVCGAVSGGLEMLEIEGRAVAEGVDRHFRALCEAAGLGPLLTRILTGYSERTPAGGFHLLYLVDTALGNTKLARRPATPEELSVHPDDRLKVLLETRGEGGYVITAPSNGKVHPSGGAWQMTAGGFGSIARISDAERDELWRVARSLDQMPPAQPRPRQKTGEDRPGDRYGALADVQERTVALLEHHGWSLIYSDGDVDFMRRPGKDVGISASVGFAGPGVLHVFSSSVPDFEPDQSYSPFSVYGTLEHAGDWSAAAAALEPPGATRGTSPALGDPPAAEAWWGGEEGSTFIPPNLAKALIAEGHLVLGEGGRLYRYAAGVYVDDGFDWLAGRVRAELDSRYRENRLREVTSYCKASMATPMQSQQSTVINLANGLLDWRTGTLRDHDPAYLSTVQLPVRWDPEATCPRFDAFLGDVLEPELVPFLEEIIGLLLIPDVRYRKAVLLRGSGQNGKSTLLAVIRALLGARNISAIGLQELGDDRFKLAELFGKLANLCADIDYRASKNSSIFKQVTGGSDYLTGERKYGQPFSFLPTVRLLFSANEAPASADQSPAYFDRWLVIPMERRIAKVDRQLLVKLTRPAELSGLLVRAVAGLRRLEQRGEFAPPGAALAALRDYQAAVDAVAGFVEDACLVAADAWVTRRDLYAAFRTWCESNGRHAPSARRFTERLREHLPSLDETALHGDRRWLGIGLPDSISE